MGTVLGEMKEIMTHLLKGILQKTTRIKGRRGVNPSGITASEFYPGMAGPYDPVCIHLVAPAVGTRMSHMNQPREPQLPEAKATSLAPFRASPNSVLPTPELRHPLPR